MISDWDTLDFDFDNGHYYYIIDSTTNVVIGRMKKPFTHYSIFKSGLSTYYIVLPEIQEYLTLKFI